MQHTATHCSTLYRTATHCNAPQHRYPAHCLYCVLPHTLQHTELPHCHTLQHTATRTHAFIDVAKIRARPFSLSSSISIVTYVPPTDCTDCCMCTPCPSDSTALRSATCSIRTSPFAPTLVNSRVCPSPLATTPA